MINMEHFKKSVDYPKEIAVKVFQMLNYETVEVDDSDWMMTIITDTNPEDLIYPEGWYFRKGCFRNKHNKTGYYEVPMEKTNGESW